MLVLEVSSSSEFFSLPAELDESICKSYLLSQIVVKYS